MTVPIGAGDSGFSLSGIDGVIGSTSGGATGISGMANLTQANVQASKAADIMGNGTLTGILGQVFSGLSSGISLPLAIIEALITRLFGLIPGFSTVEDALNAVVSIAEEAGTAVENIIGTGITDLEGALQTLLNIFGLGWLLGGSSSGGTTSSTPSVTLASLLSSSQISPTSLQALTPGAAKNVLADPTFDTGNYLQTQGLWCWDGWLGSGAFAGVNSSIRTVRRGKIIVYYIVGTTQGVYMFGGEPIGIGGNGQILEYLRDSDYHQLVDWCLIGLDPTYFEWVLVPYPAAEYPMGASVKAGYDWLADHIQSTNSPFIFVMDSQGNQVGAAVYDELRFGSLQAHRSRLLAAVGLGNLRREKGHTFPGYPDPAPGTSGMCPVSLMTTGPYSGSGNITDPTIGNLIDTEDLWWDMCVAGDYYACCPIDGVTVDPGPDVVGGNVGDIPGIPGSRLREFYSFINQAYNGNNNILTDVIAWSGRFGLGGDLNILEDYMGSVMQQINSLGAITSPHNSYFTAKPFAAKGDERSFIQVAIDYMASKAPEAVAAGLIDPSVGAERYQFLGQRFAVQEFQVVTAGASVMWVNVNAEGPAIIVAVNAYDSSDNLIATVTVDQCIIADPEPTSNWNWVDLKADFVMPPGTAKACLVLDAEPQVMTTGIVWFDSCIFEPTTLIDSKFLDLTNFPQLDAAKVAGPQGEADLLSAWQNLIDQLASANSQTNLTGTSLAQMLQSVGQTALDSSSALQLGVSHEKILGNPATQPLWSGLTPSGMVTFPLPTGTLPTVVISSGSSLMGFLNTNTVATIGFVEFMAKATSPSNIYLNVYQVDSLTGNMTLVWASGDLSSSITTSLDWVPVSIPSADQFSVTVGELVCWEVVAGGSSLTVVAETLSVTNKTYLIPPNVGASRTLAATGGNSPSTLTPSQLGYGGSAPFVCMSVSDLPPTYYAPNKKPFDSAGLFPYTIPASVKSGDYIDVVEFAGGGAAGWVDGNQYTIFGLTFGSVYNGQGGAPGARAANTFVYGTDIPAGTTQLQVIVGHGGCAPSGSGGDTIVGYGALGTPTFDAVGTGSYVYGTTTSWTHTAAEGAYVLVGLATTFGTFNVKYGDTTMIPLGLVYMDDQGPKGALAVYGLPNVPAGASTITVTTGTTAYFNANSVSYTGVSCAGAVLNTYGTGTALTQTATCAANQILVQFFSTEGYGEQAKFTGGTNRSYTYLPNGPYYSMGVSINESASSATFGATASVADNWGGISVVLNPSIEHVLLSARGGQAGGPGQASNYNPANTNNTSNGPGPGNQFWQGVTYPGGNDTTALAFPGNFPGGAGSGGTVTTNATGPAPANGAGANGRSVITARLGSSSTSITGLGGGVGSELSVVYEATGSGGVITSNNNLSWTHTSDGGPDCGVVLFCAVNYSSGAASLSASYGGYSFTFSLEGITYYNSGNGLYICAMGLIGVPSGTQTVSLGATGATINALEGSTVSYQNVGSFGNFLHSNGIGASPSISIASAGSGSMAVCGLADTYGTLNSMNQTTRWSSSSMIIGDAFGLSTASFTAVDSASDYWGAVGGILVPAS